MYSSLLELSGNRYLNKIENTKNIERYIKDTYSNLSVKLNSDIKTLASSIAGEDLSTFQLTFESMEFRGVRAREILLALISYYITGSAYAPSQLDVITRFISFVISPSAGGKDWPEERYKEVDFRGNMIAAAKIILGNSVRIPNSVMSTLAYLLTFNKDRPAQSCTNMIIKHQEDSKVAGGNDYPLHIGSVNEYTFTKMVKKDLVDSNGAMLPLYTFNGNTYPSEPAVDFDYVLHFEKSVVPFNITQVLNADFIKDHVYSCDNSFLTWNDETQDEMTREELVETVNYLYEYGLYKFVRQMFIFMGIRITKTEQFDRRILTNHKTYSPETENDLCNSIYDVYDNIMGISKEVVETVAINFVERDNGITEVIKQCSAGIIGNLISHYNEGVFIIASHKDISKDSLCNLFKNTHFESSVTKPSYDEVKGNNVLLGKVVEGQSVYIFISEDDGLMVDTAHTLAECFGSIVLMSNRTLPFLLPDKPTYLLK